MIKTEDFARVEVHSAGALRDWLLANHQQEAGVWLVTYKKSYPDKYLSTSAVLDELLCFGWIDGIRRKLDDARTMQLITPRRAQHWAKSYKERAARLMQAGRMHTAGEQAIAASKASGLWDFMTDVDNLVIPPDLATALAAAPGASMYFEEINDASKRFALRWVKLAKTAKTRQNRIAKLVMLSALGEKLPGS